MEVSIQAALADLHAGPDMFTPDCPTRVLLDHITSRWGVLILVALSGGTMRWGELRRWARGISEKMLAQTLRILEADGLVLREQRPVVPPHVDYSLTDRGRELAALLLPLMEWIIATAPPQLTAAPASTPDAQLSGRARLSATSVSGESVTGEVPPRVVDQHRLELRFGDAPITQRR